VLHGRVLVFKNGDLSQYGLLAEPKTHRSCSLGAQAPSTHLQTVSVLTRAQILTLLSHWVYFRNPGKIHLQGYIAHKKQPLTRALQ
jgi:hypothetical protein